MTTMPSVTGGTVSTQTPSFPSRLAALLAGELVSKGSVVAAFVYLARTLDPAVYGEVEWALSLLMVATLAADAGLSTWAAARVAGAPDDVPSLVARVGGLRLTLAVPAYLVLAVVAWTYGGSAGPALLVYGLVLFLTPLFLQYLFNGLFQPRWAALGNALRGLTFAVAVLLLVRPGAGPMAVALAELLGAAALALCSLVVLRKVIGLRARLRDAGRGLGVLLGQSWRTGASDVTWGVHWYAGLILLGYLATSTEAAWHSSSLRLVMALHTLVWLYLYVLLPTFARLVRSDPAAWSHTTERSLRVSSWAGFGIALVGTLGAGPLLTTVFGPAYASAVPVLRAMVWVIPVAWISGHLRYSLIAAQRPEKDYHAALVGAGTTIALAVALSPAFQSTGAGLALLGGTVANAVAAVVFARNVLPRVALARNLAASGVCAAACLAGGVALAPAMGDLGAALAATTALAACALVAERDEIAAAVRTTLLAVRPGLRPDPKAEDPI